MIHLHQDNFSETQYKALTQLTEELVRRKLQVGDSIGRQHELAARFGVSRTTIRSLFEALESRGVIRQISHRGVFLQEEFSLANGVVEENKPREVFYLRWCDSLSELKLTEGLEEFARSHQLTLYVMGIRQRLQFLLDTIRQIRPGQFLVLCPVELPGVLEALQEARERGVNILQMDRYLEDLAAPVVLPDHYATAVLAVRHLLQWGQPAWFFGYRHPISAEMRFQGWRDCMVEYGFNPPERWIIHCDEDDIACEQRPESYYDSAIREFFREHRTERPVIFCMVDSLARSTYQVAAEQKLLAGRDFFIAGIGNAAYSGRMIPPLTSVRIDEEAIGTAAGQLLFAWPGNIHYSRILPPELLIRGSSQPEHPIYAFSPTEPSVSPAMQQH